MEYSVFTVLALMTAAIMVADGDDRDGSYETNNLQSSDLSYNSHGPQQGYKEGGYGNGKGGHGTDYFAEPHYAFAYEVHDDHTGDIKAHKEERKGDHTQGMYMLVEPNGSKRIVEYVVQGKSGFNAKVHQSKPQEPHGGHGGYTGGHAVHSGYTGGHAGTGYSGQSGYVGGHAVHSGYTGEHAGQSSFTGGHAGQSSFTGEHAGQSSFIGGHSSYSGYNGVQGGHSGYTGELPAQSSYTGGSHTNSLGDYATGHYTSTNKSPYKVQENTPNYNYKPLISYKPTFNLQPFKPLIPYIPTDSQYSTNSFQHSKPMIALYRPQTSYKPLPINKASSYNFIPAHKQNSYDSQHSRGSHGHATSSVSFSSHGSNIASTTNHVIPRQKAYENKH